MHQWFTFDSKFIKDTDLTEMSINLNKWSKMNVNLAKAPFTWKTRTAIMTHLATTLDCTEQVLNIRGDSEKWKGKMKMFQIQQVHYLKQKKNKVRDRSRSIHRSILP